MLETINNFPGISHAETASTAVYNKLQLIFNLQVESGKQSPVLYQASFAALELLSAFSNTRFSGELPSRGSFIMAANHWGAVDIFLLPQAAAKLVNGGKGRSVRMVAKAQIFDPTLPQSEIVSDLQRYEKPVLPPWKHRLTAMYFRRLAPYVCVPGSDNPLNKQFMREVIGDLRSGHGVGIFPEGTRNPKLGLVEMFGSRSFPGVLTLARLTGAKIYPTGLYYHGSEIWGKKEIRVGECVTWNQLRKESLDVHPESDLDHFATSFDSKISKKELLARAMMERLAGKIAIEIKGGTNFNLDRVPEWSLYERFSCRWDDLNSLYQQGYDLGKVWDFAACTDLNYYPDLLKEVTNPSIEPVLLRNSASA